MKASQYNYLINEGEDLYCFNALSKAFFIVKQKRQNILETLLSHPDSFAQQLPSFQEKMKQGGFIVPDNYNELDIIRELYKKACNSPNLSLIILPTLNCNFHCWYCYETHSPTQMTADTIQALQLYLYNRLNSGEIKNMDIAWFGGEPFLYYYKVMLPILSYTNTLCKQLHIPFASSATTNGFLISEKIAQELGRFNVSKFQITLDGKREYHNNVRHSRQKSSFDTILQNVINICRYNPQAQILLRINYDERNLEPEPILQQISELIPKVYYKHISFLLRRIWQIPSFEEEEQKKQQFIHLLKEKGFSYSYEYDLIQDFIPCYAVRKNTLMITHDGLIGKCTTRDDFSKYAIGKLTKEGEIKWKDETINDLYSMPLFENKECLSCKELPICMGSCPKIIQSDGKIDYQSGLCVKHRNKNELKNLILNHCQSLKE